MNAKYLICLAAAAGLAAAAAPTADNRPADGAQGFHSDSLTVTADRVAADRVSGALSATGHVNAVSKPTRLMSDGFERGQDGVAHFSDPTMLTTCSNALAHLHWRITGEAQYSEAKYVLMRNVWVHFCEVPVLWLPFWYYPLDKETGWRVMPGYTSRWGAYLLTKYVYNLAGDTTWQEGSFALGGNTRFDLRYENGIALGQTLDWQLGDFGRGKFKIYYAWDVSDLYDDHWHDLTKYNWSNWGSEVTENRYGINLEHRWEVTERDTLRLKGGIYSDSYFQNDFVRKTLLGIRNDFLSRYANEVAWEHDETWCGVGLSVSGPLNDFIGGASRLPELYFDVAPTPVWRLPLTYETENRIGYLRRDYASYGDGLTDRAYAANPGVWAEYDTFRFDTYHRLAAPFKVADTLAVVPRIGYHGTYWGDTGYAVLDGNSKAGSTGDGVMRSILEGGVTFAGRGTAWIDDEWQHLLEPYADVLAQKAWYAGLGDDERAYVFDAIDASRTWEDQFAGRSRNLPYTWVGVTPGLRNALRQADEGGHLRTVLDLDAYVALQCYGADWTTGNEYHKLAENGRPNYGDGNFIAVPGVRLRWLPAVDTALSGRLEYDPDNSEIALGQVAWSQRLVRNFSYYASFSARNHRWWDYSSTPTATSLLGGSSEEFNRVYYSSVRVGFEHELCDAVVWSPFLQWDCREGELDTVGSWIDYRTDCLGFRLSLSYENSYTRIDGSEYDEEWNIGFYVYLRAFGPAVGSVLDGE